MNNEAKSPEMLGCFMHPGAEEIADAQRAAWLLDHRSRQAAAEAEGIPALVRLVHAAQGRSGQCHHLRRFLLGLYNSYEWPFELNRLRALDAELQNDCFAVLRMDLTPRCEVH